MFREMRRKNRSLNMEEIKEILAKSSYGVLSTISSDNGYPYGVPLSYSYINNEILFHSALQGHKIDNISKNNNICFTVIGDTCVLPNKFTTNYESVIIFGKIIELTDTEKEYALFELIKKYSSNFLEEGKKYIEKSANITKVFKIQIEHISGKARR